MSGFRSALVAGCCLAVTACGQPSAVPQSTPQPGVSLPKPGLVWDEDFAAHTNVESVTVAGQSILLPEGFRVPDDARPVSSTEATVAFDAPDPSALRASMQASAERAGYESLDRTSTVDVWVGHGMAVRLETHRGAQLLAWAPQSRLSQLRG